MKNLQTIRLYWKLFTKTSTSQKLIEIFIFYKNSLVVYTLSFHIRVDDNFCEKNP